MDAAALYAAAREDFRHGYRVRAHTRLRQAAEAGHAPAQLALARELLAGGLRDEALTWTLRAREAGLAAARYLHAALAYTGRARAGSPQTALDDLNAAAEDGHTNAMITLALAWLEHDGESAIHAGKLWLARAAENGSRTARLLAVVAPTPSGRKAAEPAPPLHDWAQPTTPEFKDLAEKPRIALADAAFSSLECAWLRQTARPLLRPSLVTDPVTGQPRANPVRTSTAMYFDPALPDITSSRLRERIACWTGLSVGHTEPLSVLHYHRDEEYKPHRDAFGPQALAHDPFHHAGDRVATVLVYLNTPAAGGETLFPLRKISIDPRRGRALLFMNLDTAGRPDPSSLHAGAPVRSGSKWLASQWLRERPISTDN